MKKSLLGLIALFVLSNCSSPPLNNQKINSINNNQLNNLSLNEIKFSFKIKDVQSLARVKSIDAYLVSDLTSPSTSNVYPNGYKVQADIVNGAINISFNNYSAGGPYYLALQTFDDLILSTSRKNITAINNSLTQGDKQFALSTNSVTYQNGQLNYSDNSNSLNITIDLLSFNETPVNISPENGKENPTNGIYAG